MAPIIRILTMGKPLADIDQGIVDAIQRGSRVLVKVGSSSSHLNGSHLSGGSDSENGAIANWAERLSQENGLVWQRVGPDVIFTKLINTRLVP